ncbi:MAG: phytoene desaturase family protein [Thermoanaerobaculia bacterium]
MSSGRVVVVGAGHNGLVAAVRLAKAGLRPLVLERRAAAGGMASEEEIHPGFRCPVVFSTMGPLLPALARELRLEAHGFELLAPKIRVFCPSPGGPPGAIFEDPAATAEAWKRSSPKDAERYPAFAESFRRIGRVLRPVLEMTPPSIDRPSPSEIWRLLGVGRGFRGLGKTDAYRLLRWVPMAVADLAAEWFENDLLRAAIAARGVFGAFAGPWSAGTCVGPLFQTALDGHAVAPGSFPRGGMGAFTGALVSAARAAGAEVRTGAEVRRILVRGGRAAGIELESGETIDASAVVSNADPKTTYLKLVDPAELDPDFLHKVRNFRAVGSMAKVNFALSALPAFSGAGAGHLDGRIHIGAGIDELERAYDSAKYGEISPRPSLDVSIPSVLDPSLAPTGAHVMSVTVQHAPYKLRSGDWNGRREELGEIVEKTIEDFAPGFRNLVVARRVLSPADIESELGAWGGQIFHGEPSLDQLFTMRPLLGWAKYGSPIPGLFLCGSGTHPGGGVNGLSGWNASREILKDLKTS